MSEVFMIIRRYVVRMSSITFVERIKNGYGLTDDPQRAMGFNKDDSEEVRSGKELAEELDGTLEELVITVKVESIDETP